MGLVSGHWHFEIAVSDWITTAYIVITRLGIELRPANPTRRFVVSGTKFAYIGTDFGCDGTQFWTGNAAIAHGNPANWNRLMPEDGGITVGETDYEHVGDPNEPNHDRYIFPWNGCADPRAVGIRR